MTRRLALALVFGGCITVPTEPTPTCETTADCAIGEVCEEGVCWGNPPDGPFMVTITPPNDRDLMPIEAIVASLPQDGFVGDLALSSPVSLTARVAAFCTGTCMPAPFNATVTIRRPSSFVGGPGFQTVFATTPTATDSSFNIELPPTLGGDTPYTIIVLPDGRGDEPPQVPPSPAQLVPPLQLTETVTAPGPTDLLTIQLGGTSLVTITGSVQSSVGTKLPHYRVAAQGHWSVDEPPTEVSTVAYTDTSGNYSIQLSADLVGTVDIVAKSYDPALVPVLHSGAIPIESSTINLVQPADIGNAVPVDVTIRGVNGNGQVGPVVGASVSVSAATTAAFPDTAFAVLAASDPSVTDATGTVQLQLLDGAAFNQIYTLRVVPPASSNLGVIFDDPFDLTDDHSDVRLASRIALHGVLVDSDGNPLSGVAVTAQPSLKFNWSLDDRSQQFLAQIPAATAVTPDTGDFVVFVDPQIGDTWGTYDLAFEPATSSHAPNMVKTQIDIPRDAGRTDDDVGTIQIPAAAFIHGRIVDHSTNPVEGGEVRVFATPVYTNPTNAELCIQTLHVPDGCPIPAILLGHGTSDSLGIVRLTLPRSN